MNSRSAAIVVIVIFALSFFYSIAYKKDTNENIDNYTYLTGNILKIINKNGIPKSIDRVEKAFQSGLIDINECHSLLHTVGHAAYEFYSDDLGVIISPKNSICSYGFQHGVEAQIVLEKSYDYEILKSELNKYCTNIKVSYPSIECYHGVGHALVQNGQSILSILNSCDSIAGATDTPEDCYRGAFSEYVNRMRGIDGDTDAPIPGVIPVSLSKDKIFAECLLLPSKYQKSCVAQFTSFLINMDNIEEPLEDCNLYGGWISNVCAFKITGAYMSFNIDKPNGSRLPTNLVNLRKQTIEGYIYGVVNQYQQKSGNNNLELVTKWCSDLPTEQYKKYCSSLLWVGAL